MNLSSMNPSALRLSVFAGLLASSGSLAHAQDRDAPPMIDNMGEAHAVQSGDTLWDLCSKYLNSPWYWPKIWSYNPQLTNPHWIYPGNEVRFYPGDEELPTEIDVGRSLSVEDEDLVIPGVLTDDELVKTVGTVETGRTPLDSVWTSFVGILSKDAIERAGRIVNSTSESIMLMDGVRVYIEGDEPMRQGERYAVFRAVREIVHPITGESYGRAIEIVGGLEITDTTPEVATGRITEAFRPIQRGDLIGKWPASFATRVRPVTNSQDAVGYILETASDVLGPLGEHSMVYIDQGRNDGVQNGNTFVVYHRGDRYTYETNGLPREAVGLLMVIDAQDKASTAVVVNSAYELHVGDLVKMNAGE